MGSSREDAVKLLKSGSVDITFGGSTRRLRPAKVGEYRELKQLIVQSADAVKESGTTIDSVATLDELSDRVLEEFVRTMFDKLLVSGDALPDDIEEWPPWFFSGTLQAKLLQHWRAVPLVPGAK